MIWLAGCQRDSFGKVSPHLLDRFALRLKSSSSSRRLDAEKLISWARNNSPPTDSIEVTLSEPVQLQLRSAVSHHPDIKQEVFQSVRDYFPEQKYGLRRELALARMAIAEAKLDSTPTQIKSKHIQAAARLIGLLPTGLPKAQSETDLEKLHQAEKEDSQRRSQTTILSSETPSSPSTEDLGHQTEEPVDSDGPQDFEAIPLPSDPYPEDHAQIEREPASLRLPIRRLRSTVSERGSIIGNQPTDKLHDLAVVSTIFEAAKYQRLRWQNNPDQAGKFIIRPTDWRRYRRLPLPEHLLAIVLDYTSLHDCKWVDAILEQLQWAYQNRATVCLVQVGAKSALDELRAEQLIVRNAITPRLGLALSEEAGSATPLAHGLSLARETILQAMRHGRTPIQSVRLVLLSDGRGNVPLSASLTGQIKLPINREGIEDAWHVATSIQNLKNTEVIVLDPQPQQHAELPTLLADSLNATLYPVPLKPEVQ